MKISFKKCPDVRIISTLRKAWNIPKLSFQSYPNFRSKPGSSSSEKHSRERPKIFLYYKHYKIDIAIFYKIDIPENYRNSEYVWMRGVPPK